VAQDYDSEIWFTLNDPVKYGGYWSVAKDDHQIQESCLVFYGKAPNWQNSKIDLRENDFEIVNGELVAIPKIEENWLPIDTAPKDGTTVELKNVNNGLRDVGCWCDYRERGSLSGLEGEWNQELGNGDMTHWRSKMPEMLKEQA